MFSTEHFIWIGLCAAFVAGMLIFCIRKKVSLKVAGYVMSGICLCSESSKILSNMVESPLGKKEGASSASLTLWRSWARWEAFVPY